MPKAATLNGERITTVKFAPGVLFHLTTGDDEGDIRVTPEIFKKLQNSSAFNIPALVVSAIGKHVSDTLTDETK